MGNNVGKAIGTAAGAGLLLIPGIGTVAGIGIMAASQTIGSAIDAIADNERQQAEARRRAEEARRTTEQQIESQRQAEQQRLSEQEIEIRRIQEQTNMVRQIIEACGRDNVVQVRNLLPNLDDHHFYSVLGQRPLAACISPDSREQVRHLLEQEEMRREGDEYIPQTMPTNGR